MPRRNIDRIVETNDIPGSDLENTDNKSTAFLGEEKECDKEFNKKEDENRDEVGDEVCDEVCDKKERQFQKVLSRPRWKSDHRI